MAVASSLATTLSLLPLHHASAKSSFLSFSLLSPNLSLRLSRSSSPRLYAAPEDSDQFELDEGADDEDDSDQFELDKGADDEDDSDQFELDENYNAMEYWRITSTVIPNYRCENPNAACA